MPIFINLYLPPRETISQLTCVEPSNTCAYGYAEGERALHEGPVCSYWKDSDTIIKIERIEVPETVTRVCTSQTDIHNDLVYKVVVFVLHLLRSKQGLLRCAHWQKMPITIIRMRVIEKENLCLACWSYYVLIIIDYLYLIGLVRALNYKFIYLNQSISKLEKMINFHIIFFRMIKQISIITQTPHSHSLIIDIAAASIIKDHYIKYFFPFLSSPALFNWRQLFVWGKHDIRGLTINPTVSVLPIII